MWKYVLLYLALAIAEVNGLIIPHWCFVLTVVFGMISVPIEFISAMIRKDD